MWLLRQSDIFMGFFFLHFIRIFWTDVTCTGESTVFPSISFWSGNKESAYIQSQILWSDVMRLEISDWSPPTWNSSAELRLGTGRVTHGDRWRMPWMFCCDLDVSTESQKEPDREDRKETGDHLREHLLSGSRLRYLGGCFGLNSSHCVLLSVSSGSWRWKAKHTIIWWLHKHKELMSSEFWNLCRWNWLQKDG